MHAGTKIRACNHREVKFTFDCSRYDEDVSLHP